MSGIEKKILEVQRDIQSDIHKVDQNVQGLNTTLLEVATKLTWSYEELLKQQRKNNEQDVKLKNHNIWLWINSGLIAMLFIIVIAWI